MRRSTLLAIVVPLLLIAPPVVPGQVRPMNFTRGNATAVNFGVHEVVLNGDGSVANPFDTLVTVRFTPPSGVEKVRTVWAFFDGENTWRARIYTNETGEWTWSAHCETNASWGNSSGTFRCQPSSLRGRLLPHARNPRQWQTENGKWFLNLSDTAYFLLCGHDGNGTPVTDEIAKQYVHDDVARGITSLRCFLASGDSGFSESTRQWREWFFTDDSYSRLRLDNLQCADRRLQMLLNDYPEVAVQLILFPLEAYNRDDRFWTALPPPKREQLLRNLVARFAAYPQILWLITNDAHYGPKFPNSNAHVREVGAFLQKHDPWQHPRSTGHARRLPFAFGGEDWATYIHIEHAHDLGAQEYAAYHPHAKPVFLGEDRYEQDHGTRLDPFQMRYWQRRLFWSWLLAGGSANYGGRWWAVQPYGQTGTIPATYHQRPQTTFRTALTGLDSVLAIRSYFSGRGIDLGDFEPDSNRVEDCDGRQAAQAPRLMRREKEEYLVYHPHAAADGQVALVESTRAARLRINLTDAPGTFTSEWYRAEDGEHQPGEVVAGGGWRELTAPWVGADVVLRLKRK